MSIRQNVAAVLIRDERILLAAFDDATGPRLLLAAARHPASGCTFFSGTI